MSHHPHHHNNNYNSHFTPNLTGHHPPSPPLNPPNTNNHNHTHRRRHHYYHHHHHVTTTSNTTPYHIRPRAVSFGNPALGTYHGYVYTIERRSDTVQNEDDTNQSDSLFQLLKSPHRPLMEGNDDDNENDDDDVVEVRNMAVMVQVPPNQVPDGILHVALSHRPYIRQVRIMIDEENNDNDVSDGTRKNDARFEEEKTETGMTSTTTVTSTKKSHAERTYLVLFELWNEEHVYQFVNDLHGQPYTFLDDSITCQVYHALALKGISCGSSVMSSPLLRNHDATLPNHGIPLTTTTATTTPLAVTSENDNNKTVEVYNCAVCLEGMEFDRDGDDEHFQESKSILTTVCNHTFHIDCLAQWQDSPCPVCRYDHSGLNDEAILSQCHVCSTTHKNYVCLICGTVSCGGGIDNQQSTAVSISISMEASTSTNTNTNATAMTRQYHIASDDGSSCHDTTENFEMAMMQQRQRYQIAPNSHAWKHYNETLHAYALCTETQHVWDFAGQGYVHRLLQNKDDGKLVEVHDPTNTTSQERSSSPGLTQAQEGEVVHRKLESFASQYYTLLKSQLEQQRAYFEGRLEEVRRDYSNSTTIHRAPKKRVDTAADLIVALKQERQQLTQRLETIQAKCRKVNGDVTFLKSLNESLEANRESFRRQLEEAERERAEARKMIEESLPPLQEKVTLLMLQLESTSNSASSGNDETT